MSTIFETFTLRPTATIFLLAARYWFPSLLPHVCLNLACDTLCSTSMRSEGSAHTLATSTPKNRDSGWSGGKLDWLHQGMQVPKLSLLSSLTRALQLPGSGRLPLVRRDGSPHSVKACVRLQCIECLCLPCRRLPGSVLVLLHDMCEDDPRHFSP